MEKIKVLVVEDSLMFRSLLVKYINMDPELTVVAVASDPFEARDAIIRYKPDVMTLDVELPKMDGIEFLRKLMPQYPMHTIVISTLSNRVFDALNAGAVDFVAKPLTTNKEALDEFVKRELPGKIKVAATAKIRKTYAQRVLTQGNYAKIPIAANDDENSPNVSLRRDEQLIVAIGASTGGTEATTSILEQLGPDIPGVVVAQHMPEGFTKMYADRLNQRSNIRLTVKEAQSGDIVLPGHVYIAPGGDKHMEIVRANNQYKIVLKRGEKVNGHRPSVEVLFQSVAREAGKNAVGIILTGMGGDGAKGLLAMKRAGAKTIGQDESTCVVYGMPRVAYEMGAVDYQEKLQNIPSKTYSIIAQMQKEN